MHVYEQVHVHVHDLFGENRYPGIMCARYTMATAPDQLIEEFEATIADLSL